MIFNPTRTEDWLRCPVYCSYKRTWGPLDDAWTPNMLIGTMMHAGAEAYMHSTEQTDIELAMEAAFAYEYVEQDEWPAAMVRDLARKAYNCLQPQLATILEREEVVGVETPLLPHQHHPAVGRVSRADLITQIAEGFVITDYKYSYKVDPQYRLKRLQEYDASFQLWCYAWELAQETKHTGPPVAWLRVIQVVGTPKATLDLTTIRVTPARLAFFERGASAAWRAMAEEIDNGARPAPNLTSCHGKYGKCAYYAACHECHGDEAMIAVLYKRLHKDVQAQLKPAAEGSLP